MAQAYQHHGFYNFHVLLFTPVLGWAVGSLDIAGPPWCRAQWPSLRIGGHLLAFAASPEI